MARLTDSQAGQLARDGYLLLPSLLAPAARHAVLASLEDLWAKEGAAAGIENYIESGARRLANLYNKGEVFRALYTHPLVLAAGRTVLGDEIRLSMLNARDVPPGSDPRQPLHTDVDGDLRPNTGQADVFTAIWMLDHFTRRSGATRFVPGSHRQAALPSEALDDVYAPHPDEVILEGRAGDVLVFNAHGWHAGGENRSQGPRRAVLVHYVRAGSPSRLDPARDLLPATIRAATPLERRLLGLEDGDSGGS